VQNGLPWWYFLGQSGPFSNLSLRSLDADGTLEQHIPVSKVIGCVAYPAATVIEPGLTRIVEGNRLTFGEPDNSSSDRSTRIADACTSGGLKGFVTQDIRAELWLKAWGALAFNTVSALTGSTMREIAQDPGTRALVTRVMTEAQTIASKLGVQIRHTIEKRIEGATQVGAHKTSMLQDVEAGRTLEINAVIGVFVELAALTSTPAPSIEAIHACCNLLNARLARTGADGLPGSGMARPSPLAQLDGGMS
jgi:2-dehydropantoate 2-reductase